MRIQITITLEPGEEMPEINLSPPSNHHRDSQLDSLVENAAMPLASPHPIGFRA